MFENFVKPGEFFAPFPYAPGYYISNFGRWASVKNNKQRVLVQEKNNNGYQRGKVYINGQRKHFFTHIAVVSVFGDIRGKTIGWLEGTLQQNGLSIDHIDGNKFNNSVSNLEIVSHAENMQRYYDRAASVNIEEFF